MKKVLYVIGLALLAVSCTDDYTDWASPFKNDPEAAKSVTMNIGSVGTIDLATVTTETVKILSPSIEIDDEAEITYQAKIYGPEEGKNAEFEIDSEGCILTSVLEDAVYSLYGRRPVTRNIPMDVVGLVKVGGQTLKAMGSTTLSVIPNTPQISENYYIVGGPNDWAGSAASKELKFQHSGKDVYEDPVFTIIFNAPDGDCWFAIGDDEACDAIANNNDWSKLFGTTKGNGNTDLTGSLDRRYNLSDDGSFCVPAGNKLIKVTLNMMDYAYTIEPLNIAENYYLIGGPGEWNNSKDQKFSHSDKSVFDDPVFTYTFASTGSEMWFAFGDDEAIDAVGEGVWNKLFGTKDDSKDLSGSFDRRYNLDGDHSFCVDGQAKYYRFSVNMMDFTYTITPLNFGEFYYEIGNEGGWSTAHALYSANSDGKYQGYYWLDGEYKFKPNADNWDNDLEYVSGDAMGGTLTDGGGPNCPDPGAGFYRIDLDVAAMTFALKKIEYVSIIGTANGNWDTDTDLTYNKDEGCWEVTCDLNAGEMKFRGNHNWDGDVDLGGSFDSLVHGGSNIAVEAGNYTIKLYISIAGKHHAVVKKN